MKKLNFVFTVVCCLLSVVCFSQTGYNGESGKRWLKDTTLITSQLKVNNPAGAIIGGYNKNADAILELSSTTKGLLLPRLTTAQQNAIASPTAGLVIYNTDSGKVCLYSGAWVCQAQGGASLVNALQNGLNLSSGTGELGGSDLLHETFVGIPATTSLFFHNEDTSKYFGIGDADLDGRWLVAGLVDQLLIEDTSGNHLAFGYSAAWGEPICEIITHHIILDAVDVLHLGVNNGTDSAVVLLDTAALQYLGNGDTARWAINANGDAYFFAYPNTREDTPDSLYNLLGTGSSGKLLSYGIGDVVSLMRDSLATDNIIQPNKQIVYGNGTSIVSSPMFTFDTVYPGELKLGIPTDTVSKFTQHIGNNEAAWSWGLRTGTDKPGRDLVFNFQKGTGNQIGGGLRMLSTIPGASGSTTGTQFTLATFQADATVLGDFANAWANTTPAILTIDHEDGFISLAGDSTQFNAYPTGQITSANYTPTLTNTTNITSSSVNIDTRYQRIGDIVTAYYSLIVDPAVTATPTEIRVTLPIDSNPSASLSGSGAFNDTNPVAACVVPVDASHAAILFTPVATSNTVLNFSVSYRVN